MTSMTPMTAPSRHPHRPGRRRWLQATGALVIASRSQAAAAQPAPRLVASFSILADMLRELAPVDAEVGTLVGPNADAHVFEPTPAAGRRLARADLVVVNGLGFEGWIDRLVKVSGFRGPVLVASRDIEPLRRPRAPQDSGHHGQDHAHGHAHGPGSADPHAWQDLRRGRRYAVTIAAALRARWPERTADLQAREADYLRRIDALDAQVRGWLAAVPRTERRVITAHDAFVYFGAAYGVDFLAPRGWTTGSEPSAAAVAQLVRQIRAQQVRALFLENISDPRLVERIARETGARVGGTLYSDALSAPDGPAGTYLKLVEHNARTLATALAG